jgi:hypothetical protein
MEEKHKIQCVLFDTLVFLLVSLNITYDITYNTIGKAFGISESKWKPAQGGSNLDCVGFWVHLVVFAIIVWSRYGFK